MKRRSILCIFFALVLFGCNSVKNNDEETLYSGRIKIAVDESFKPIIEEVLQVYHALTPEATIEPIYCSEVEAVDLLLKDSVRFAVANRRLTERETASLNARKFFPESVRFAVGGIALITNRQNRDSLITVGQIQNVLSGKINQWNGLYPDSDLGEIRVVFDNPNSGTVHFALDSICRGKEMSPLSVKAKRNSREVIDLVAKDPGAIGFIGVNWVGNPVDTARLSFNDKIRVLAVSDSDKATVENSFKPYQAYLALRKYPLTHDIFILINDPKGALPTGLMTFMTGDKGQRIILKSGLVPATQPVRLVNVKDEF